MFKGYEKIYSRPQPKKNRWHKCHGATRKALINSERRAADKKAVKDGEGDQPETKQGDRP